MACNSVPSMRWDKEKPALTQNERACKSESPAHCVGQKLPQKIRECLNKRHSVAYNHSKQTTEDRRQVIFAEHSSTVFFSLHKAIVLKHWSVLIDFHYLVLSFLSSFFVFHIKLKLQKEALQSTYICNLSMSTGQLHNYSSIWQHLAIF